MELDLSQLRPLRCLLLAALMFAPGCQAPPPDSYVSVPSARRVREVSLGTNTAGEACSQASASGTAAEVYCGTWEQPSGRVRSGGPATAASLAGLATEGPWRASLDQRYVCGAPRPGTVLGSNPAVLLDCTRRNGGWPQIAFVALAGGRAWLADGVLPAVPAIERSIGVLSGMTTATATLAAGGDALLAQRMAARSFGSGDVGQFDALMVAGNRANLESNPAAAERAYRSALDIQEKKLGRSDPGQASPVMHVALQVSNQGRFAEASSLFARAEQLMRGSTNELDRARLLHYQALHAVNQDRNEEALGLLAQADRTYTAVLSDYGVRLPERLGSGQGGRLSSMREQASTLPDAGAELQYIPAQNAMLGLVEVRRYRAEALRSLNRLADSDTAYREAEALARWSGVDRSILVARLARTGAQTATSLGDLPTATELYSRSTRAMDDALPGTGINARGRLQQGAEAFRAGDAASALRHCRAGLRALTTLQQGVPPGQAVACMDVFAAAAADARDPARRQAELADMFLTGQLAQSNFTTQQIQVSATRLKENSRNPAIAEAIGRYQQASLASARAASAATQQGSSRPGGPPTPAVADLARQVVDARQAESESEEGLQALFPLYKSTVQKPATVTEVQNALRPSEAMVAITLSGDGGWTLLVRKDRIEAVVIKGGARTVDPLVRRIREGLVQRSPMPRFDIEASMSLYGATLGGLGDKLDGVTSLVVAPSGSLLSIPFGLLLTGPADADNLGAAPWLIRRNTVAHVPAAVTFVLLRGIAGQSRATQPWFGFGDFQHVTAAQARAAYPGACAPNAELLQRLAPLPFARKELEDARDIFGAPRSDALLGAAFTPAAVGQVALKDFRVVHFATHALLQSELRSDLNCQTDAVIVASPPPRAQSATAALLSASAIEQLQLDADVVVLSACNTGSADGARGGESLASLARSFFSAGARSLLVSNWDANDAAAYYMVTNTLRRLKQEPGLGIAGAQRAAAVSVLDDAGRTLSADFAHPFFWAPFTVIGDDGALTGARRLSGL